jgi:ABC-type multidrug transport system fused ATPase/permease subunit
VRDIQIFTQEARAARAYRAQLERLAETMTRNMGLSVTNFAISYSLTGLGLALVYGVGLLILITSPGLFGGRVEAGLLASFAAFFVQFTNPIGALSGALLRWQAMLIAAGRVFSLMHVRPGVDDRTGAKDPGVLKGHIRFENVHFSYEPENPEAWAMENISLEIKPGEKVAFVGGSGSGKSTILNLVARFHDVTRGRVTIDGYDVRELSLQALRRNIGLVAQNVLLFRGTLADNIRFGRPEADMAAVRSAAQVGYVTQFVDQLDDGYETHLGEMGQGLSGGQKQRVSIARAALVNPSILLLDEATSALDTESEAMVTRSLDALSRGRTTLIIAHRLNTIRNADKIIVMGTDSLGNGVVRAAGTHEQLMESSPEYVALYGKQRRKAILMPIGPLYDTTAALPTVLGLALAYKAPVFVLDFGPLDVEDATDRRFGVSVVLTKEDPRVINAKHLRRVNGIMSELTGEGVEAKVVHPPAAETLDWVEATLRVIAETDATHLVAVDNVLVPMDKMRESIRLIERKGGVEYILINPIAEVD